MSWPFQPYKPAPSFRLKFIFKRFLAFTLAELLIAVVILGLIAGFTIPKVLTSIGDSQYKAIIKESLSSALGVIHNANLNGTANYTDGYATLPKLMAALNVVTSCGEIDSGTANNCFATVPCKPLTICQSWVSSGTLHNGASIAFTVAGVAPLNYYILVDANGPKAPNVIGNDQVVAGFSESARMLIPGGVHLSNGTNVDAINATFLTGLFK
jgi:type II secretory pathway pseudopilin PulG